MPELEMNYPPELPVCGRRREILAALRSHRTVIVCGDTGSGKTTQLPKMALETLLQSSRNSRRAPRIACTQPRRLAAVTMAERVAAELKTELGDLVGYRHRYGRKVSPSTAIEFMTDGVLLAETRGDPLLRAYDAIIVDEAHERSLNIDFLLGILKRILERRRDLTVVIASATLDTDNFSAFFGNAPVLNVPGRTFPVEIGYRPPPDDEERDLPRDVAAAVGELPPDGDVLVFLPGERDIRETADHLRDVRGSLDDVIPLLASLPAGEQRRAFLPSPRRRIILATNVAETSVTIPGIRAVVDSGLARISRYVHRTQVQRLQIEPVSQASAKQRAGRCGRLGPGVCLRLYSEEDLLARDAYTQPELLRSSLAGVILTMLDLGLGDIEQFPFLTPPKPAMVREGLRELLELGAIARGSGSAIILTATGRQLARLPVEPRLARMLLAAAQNGVLNETLPLVAAMACDDPRRRPLDEREKADQAHARFRVPGSDFLGTLALWRWWSGQAEELSQSKLRRLCQSSYLSYPKMREWRDLVQQLAGLCRRLELSFACGIRREDEEELAGAIHRSLLSGLLGRIGKYDPEANEYRGAHGLRFALHPGSVLAKRPRRERNEKKSAPPEWIVAGELVDTARLYARNAAAIDVRWLEPVAGEICRRSHHSPEWDGRYGFVRATEQVTLYGLVIVPARRCDFSRIDPRLAREIFIRHGLVEGDFPRPPPVVRANNALIGRLRKLAERSRRPDWFDADRLCAHFGQTLPDGICSADGLRKWLAADPQAQDWLRLDESDWRPPDGGSSRDFPDSLRIANATLSLEYRHSPETPEEDGVTCTLRAADAGVLRLWRSDWLVPGMLREKVLWMLGTLPSALRRILSPLDDTAAILLSELRPGADSLENAVRNAIHARWGFRVPENAWRWEKLPGHLRMRFRMLDDRTGKTIAVTRDPDEAVRLAGGASASSPSAGDGATDSGVATGWIFGDLPESKSDRNSGWTTVSYPALADCGDGVRLKLFADRVRAEDVHAAGVARLLLLALEKKLATPFRRNRLSLDAAMHLKAIGYADEQIAADVLAGAVREALVRNLPPVRTEAEFRARCGGDLASVVQCQTEIAAILAASAESANRIAAKAESAQLPEETAGEIESQIAWLFYRGFPRLVPLANLRRYSRYFKGMEVRLERARLSPASDRKKAELFAPHWNRYLELTRQLRAPKPPAANLRALAEYRWMAEEYRISLFAQELRTPEPVSPKRLDAKWREATGDADGR